MLGALNSLSHHFIFEVTQFYLSQSAFPETSLMICSRSLIKPHRIITGSLQTLSRVPCEDFPSETSLRSKRNFTKVAGELTCSFCLNSFELTLSRATVTVKAFDRDNHGFKRTNMK